MILNLGFKLLVFLVQNKKKYLSAWVFRLMQSGGDRAKVKQEHHSIHTKKTKTVIKNNNKKKKLRGYTLFTKQFLIKFIKNILILRS